jgi:hypothetical protein
MANPLRGPLFQLQNVFCVGARHAAPVAGDRDCAASSLFTAGVSKASLHAACVAVVESPVARLSAAAMTCVNGADTSSDPTAIRVAADRALAENRRREGRFIGGSGVLRS